MNFQDDQQNTYHNTYHIPSEPKYDLMLILSIIR